MREAKNILKHELIGLSVAIVDARNKSLIGITGTVVDETRNTLVIETVHGEKNMLKEGIVLKVRVENEDILINGAHLVGRPEDRIKK